MKTLKIVVLAAVLAASGLAADNSLYKNNCATCHGIKGEKSAIGKSKPIKGMPADQVIKALEEYGSGAKASALPVAKVIKHRFTSRYNKEQIQEVADYVSKL